MPPPTDITIIVTIERRVASDVVVAVEGRGRDPAQGEYSVKSPGRDSTLANTPQPRSRALVVAVAGRNPPYPLCLLVKLGIGLMKGTPGIASLVDEHVMAVSVTVRASIPTAPP